MYHKKNKNDWLAERMNDEWMNAWMDEQRTGLVNDLRMTAAAEKIN